MKNEFPSGEFRPQGSEIERGGKRVDEKVAGVGGQLEEAQLLGIGMQAVGLCVDGDPVSRIQAGKPFTQRFVRSNHRGKIRDSRGVCRDMEDASVLLYQIDRRWLAILPFAPDEELL